MEELIKKFETYLPEEQQRLGDKYRNLLYQDYYGDDQGLNLTLYSLNFLINYINENCKEESKDIKAWCGVILMRKIKNKTLNTEDDITNIIIKTVNHFKKEEYSIYLSDIVNFSNEYDRDIEYLNKLVI